MPAKRVMPVPQPPLKAVDIAREHTAKGWRAWFADFSRRCSNTVGTPVVFFLAVGVVLVWAITGPLFGFSDTWQLVINTGTTIITFLMVFLIQSTQNRDAKALHFKVDELLHAVHGAHEELIDVEDLTDEELDELAEHYHQVRAERASKRAPQPKANGKKKPGGKKPAA